MQNDGAIPMHTVIEFSTDGIYVVDGAGVTLLVNQAYEQIAGFDRRELIGKHMNELMEDGYLDQSVSLLVLEQKRRIPLMQTLGGKKEVIVTGNPVFDEEGNIQFVITSVCDITALNETKRQLEKARNFSELQKNRYVYQGHSDKEKFIFQSEQMQRVYEQVCQVAPYPSTVLLSGPSGAGKEVIATLLHNKSGRKDKPYIKINCGAIPEPLLESELFGYEEGAFTGASRKGKIGLLELADGGTVMLDEIGEMPPLLQVKLLRILQEKQVTRIGGTKSRPLDIRIISATNRDLRAMVKEGTFREDLYYRLQVVEIQLPPLAERPEDVRLLIDHYFSFYKHEYRVDKTISADTMDILMTYHWPGNVRELKNLVESMLVSVPASVIQPVHLPRHLSDTLHGLAPETIKLKQKVQQYEKKLIQEALTKHHSLRKTALHLGIDHSTLIKKLKRLQIETK
ncbi:sigma-54 interaction domain-containing protein [Aneurinibacillus migulanus]|uniref:sigma-54 interaction domain-containing protein n=1 Tax=Aneurinibacillus migulanus TaxID=47500 RepID=UPI00209D4189|nr:sigma 54-interacting transcriptional regulator [Aneurinibacillus migulanus]MCP1358690.1 sigma 54-interacting transcriptional regulator [Aneurinibacillus migulanus]